MKALDLTIDNCPSTEFCSHLTNLESRIEELEAENNRLKQCAKAQAKGSGAKTLRMELVPHGNQLSVIATFPSSDMEDGERMAAEAAASLLALTLETAHHMQNAAKA